MKKHVWARRNASKNGSCRLSYMYSVRILVVSWPLVIETVASIVGMVLIIILLEYTICICENTVLHYNSKRFRWKFRCSGCYLEQIFCTHVISGACRCLSWYFSVFKIILKNSCTSDMSWYPHPRPPPQTRAGGRRPKRFRWKFDVVATSNILTHRAKQTCPRRDMNVISGTCRCLSY